MKTLKNTCVLAITIKSTLKCPKLRCEVVHSRTPWHPTLSMMEVVLATNCHRRRLSINAYNNNQVSLQLRVRSHDSIAQSSFKPTSCLFHRYGIRGEQKANSNHQKIDPSACLPKTPKERRMQCIYIPVILKVSYRASWIDTRTLQTVLFFPSVA